MNISLMVMDGAHAGDVIAVAGLYLLVGRGAQAHVRPNSPLVSERHCALLQRPDGFFLRDLESKSGTFLNDRRLRGEIELRDGDLVRVGPLTFLVQLAAQGERRLTALDEPPSERSLSSSADMEVQPLAAPTFAPLAAETQSMPAQEPLPLPEPAWETPQEVNDPRPVDHVGELTGVRSVAGGVRRTRVVWENARSRSPT